MCQNCFSIVLLTYWNLQILVTAFFIRFLPSFFTCSFRVLLSCSRSTILCKIKWATMISQAMSPFPPNQCWNFKLNFNVMPSNDANTDSPTLEGVRVLSCLVYFADDCLKQERLECAHNWLNCCMICWTMVVCIITRKKI